MCDGTSTRLSENGAHNTYRRNDKLIVLLRSPNLSGARGGILINGKPYRNFLWILSIIFSAANVPSTPRFSNGLIWTTQRVIKKIIFNIIFDYFNFLRSFFLMHTPQILLCSTECANNKMMRHFRMRFMQSTNTY